MHHTTSVDDGVVTRMQGCEGLIGEVRNPVTKLVVMSGDKAIFFQSGAWVMENFPPHPYQL